MNFLQAFIVMQQGFRVRRAGCNGVVFIDMDSDVFLCVDGRIDPDGDDYDPEDFILTPADSAATDWEIAP